MSVLCVELAINTTRVVYLAWCADLGCKTVPYMMQRIMLTVLMPLGFVTSTMVAVYYAEMNKLSKKSDNATRRVRWAATSFCTGVVCLDVLAACLDGGFLVSRSGVEVIRIIAAVLQIIGNVVVSVGLFKMVGRVLATLRANSKSKTRQDNTSEKISSRLRISAVFIGVQVLASLGMGTSLKGTVSGFHAITFFWRVSAIAVSFFQVRSFKVPPQDRRQTQSMSVWKARATKHSLRSLSLSPRGFRPKPWPGKQAPMAGVLPMAPVTVQVQLIPSPKQPGI